MISAHVTCNGGLLDGLFCLNDTSGTLCWFTLVRHEEETHIDPTAGIDPSEESVERDEPTVEEPAPVDDVTGSGETVDEPSADGDLGSEDDVTDPAADADASEEPAVVDEPGVVTEVQAPATVGESIEPAMAEAPNSAAPLPADTSAEMPASSGEAEQLES